MNSKISETYDPYRLLLNLQLNLSGKTDLKRSDKYIVFPNLNIYYTWKNIKKAI